MSKLGNLDTSSSVQLHKCPKFQNWTQNHRFYENLRTDIPTGGQIKIEKETLIAY